MKTRLTSALLLALLWLAACSMPEPAVPVMDAPDGVQRAFALARREVNRLHGDIMPVDDGAWQLERLTPTGLVGAETFQYRYETCFATVTYPVVAPDQTIYTVSIIDNAMGLYWQGRFDAAGDLLWPDGDGDATKLPNPSAAYCVEQGYGYVIRTDDAGNQFGVCVFDDGTECDAWAYYRGECLPIGDSSAERLNLTALLQLDRAVGLTVEQLTPAGFVLLRQVDDPAVIAALGDALNGPLARTARQVCADSYRLSFHLSGGDTQTLTYLCTDESAPQLRGGQVFWGGNDAVAPQAFNELFTRITAGRGA